MMDALFEAKATVKELFQKADTARQGRISEAQLASVLPSIPTEGLALVFRFVGPDMDGKVGYPQLRQALEGVSSAKGASLAKLQGETAGAGTSGWAADWEEAGFETVRAWIKQSRYTIEEAFQAAGAVDSLLSRQAFKGFLQVLNPGWTGAQLDRLARFMDRSGHGAKNGISLDDWSSRFGDGSSISWEAAGFRRVRQVSSSHLPTPRSLPVL